MLMQIKNIQIKKKSKIKAKLTIMLGFDDFFFLFYKVAWLRSDSKAILAIHTHMVTNNPRMKVEHNGHNSWTLNLDGVQRNDSGLYMCQINTEPMISQVS